MARGTTLGEAVNQLRIAASFDPNPALSINVVDQMKQLLREEQERLYDEFDWPFLKITRDVTMEAGSRYYDVPTDLSLERLQKVDILYGGTWIAVERGISLDEYNASNSDDDLRMDPVQRWDVKDTGSGAQIEVWPVPASDGGALRFTGIRNLARLINNSDQMDLDDQMVVNFVAAEMLASRNDKAASSKLAKAKARRETLQGRVMRTRGNKINFAGKQMDGVSCERRPPLVAYVRTP